MSNEGHSGDTPARRKRTLKRTAATVPATLVQEMLARSRGHRPKRAASPNRECDVSVFTMNSERLLKALFGDKQMHGATGGRSLKYTKDTYQRILTALAHSVEANILVDNEHHRESLDWCLQTALQCVGDAKTTATVQAEMVAWVTRLCFELLGGMPRHEDSKRVNRYDWTAAQHVVYVESPEQKLHRLYAAVVDHLKNTWDHGECTQRRLDLGVIRKGGYQQQIAELRTAYPAVYDQLFPSAAKAATQGRLV